jgi:transposase-like protein
MLQMGTDEAWLWVAVELYNTQTNSWIYISRHMNMIAAESLLRSLITTYGKYIVYSDGGTWCPEACVSLGLKHSYIHHMKRI